MSITFMPYIYEPKDGVWRIPASCDRDDDDRFSINMANSNALDVLGYLGYPDVSMSDPPVPIEAFLNLTSSVLRQSIDRPSPAIEIRTSGAKTGRTIIHGGRGEGYIQKRLHQLAVMARECRDAGATHIGWA